jgi:hypothetical protein
VNSKSDEHEGDQDGPGAVHRVQDNWVVPKPLPNHAPQGDKRRVQGQDQAKVLAIYAEERNINCYVVCPVRQCDQGNGNEALPIRLCSFRSVRSKE